MELRKQQEIAHYDKLAGEWSAKIAKNPEAAAKLDIEAVEVTKMSSYQFLYKLLKKYVVSKRVLDYGCGHGMHAIELAKMGAKEVIGIDLSEESLKIAKERVKREELKGKISFIKMDAESLEFPTSSFDVVFDGGTFSSIELEKGLQEIKRVLNPGGVLIGIETLGHHPLGNLKRWLNKKRGVRTDWATAHIIKMSDLKLMERYFVPEKLAFFHFASLLTIPFSRFPGGSVINSLANSFDKFLFAMFPLTKRYGFKVVFVFSKSK